MLAVGLLQYADNLLRPTASGKTPAVKVPGPFNVDAETLELSLALARRGSELAVEAELDPDNVKVNVNWIGIKGNAAGLLINYLPRIHEMRKTLTEAERSVMVTIRANHIRVLDLRCERIRKAVHDKLSFDHYTLELFA